MAFMTKEIREGKDLYAAETPDARIVELPELEGKGFAGCHIKL